MVLEMLVPENLAEKRWTYAFILGALYSIIGIILASMLFPADPSLVAVAFTAILLIPTIRKLYSAEEKEIKRDNRFSFKALWRQENDFIKFYLVLILGIFLVYAISALILPTMSVNGLFRDQLELRGGGAVDNSSGAAFAGKAFDNQLFVNLLSNNIIVLIACILMSFLTGDGAIFLLVWNASLWGTIFGVVARNASIVMNIHPALLLFIVLAIVLPHAFLEMLGYITGAVAGGLMSNDIELEQGESKNQQYTKTYWKTAFWIIIIAIVIIVIGAAVETYVLKSVTLYKDIIKQSFMV
jgi:uncharacterized membrane protein SpoIIM required for sporulation